MFDLCAVLNGSPSHSDGVGPLLHHLHRLLMENLPLSGLLNHSLLSGLVLVQFILDPLPISLGQNGNLSEVWKLEPPAVFAN